MHYQQLVRELRIKLIWTAINAGKKVTIHYTAIFYSSFSVSL